jgi:hypothetical protein
MQVMKRRAATELLALLGLATVAEGAPAFAALFPNRARPVQERHRRFLPSSF